MELAQGATFMVKAEVMAMVAIMALVIAKLMVMVAIAKAMVELMAKVVEQLVNFEANFTKLAKELVELKVAAITVATVLLWLLAI